MMFGSKVKYGITYKTNQKSFDIWRREYQHNFCSNVVSENFSGCIGIPIESMNALCVSKIDEVKFYNLKTFEELKESKLVIPLLKSESREPNQVIAMKISKNE